MYTALLYLHSYLRWAVLVLAALAFARALRGWQGRRAYTAGDGATGLAFIAALDAQVLLGLVLHLAVSPITKAAMAMGGAAMRSRDTRYWLVEHGFTALVALVAAHVGRARSKRAGDDAARHRAAAIGFGVALALLAITVPWPFLAIGRPLVRP